jgi:hypothetical protein
MKETVLKKEFSKKDVQRMRNIITKRTGDKTQVLAGWEKKIEEHKEGDVWEENGRSWTISNGIKQTVTKLDRFKQMVVLPLCCPKCSKPMRIDELNKKMYAIHQICFDCVIDMEAEIKKEGKWDEYVSNQRNANKNAQLDDLERQIESWLNQKDSFVSESGEVESWSEGDKTKMYEEVKQWIEEQKQVTL